MLESVNKPEDIRNLGMEELRSLCTEIRTYMIDCCSTNPGHLGSSLGAVELIVGLHHVYDTPKDRIVFDVSHQAYAHKIITGRREAFRKNRMKDGISGFTNRSESEYDCFGAGHASTSISAALGFAEASKLTGDGAKAVALIGDGALSGGLAFEGLNNAGDSDADLLIILNDNNISIDRNIGAIHQDLLRITTNSTYNNIRNKVWDALGEGRPREAIRRMVKGTKAALIKKSGLELFEAFGFRYFGPIDGNDMEQVVGALRRLRNMKGPRILHAVTTKGKGFSPAEESPTIWHAPGKFDPETGERVPGSKGADRYQDVFGEVLLELAGKDGRVVGITPAMASGCGMNLLAQEMPERFFDVGIAEEHAATFAAGLAAAGLKPFCNIYSSFAQRAYDEIIHDAVLQKLPVTFCFDRAGLVGEDGATHQGAFDISMLRSIPDLIIAVPSDELELKSMMYAACEGEHKCPYIIRYPRGNGEGVPWRESVPAPMEAGRGRILHPGSGEISVIAAGPVVHRAVEAVRELETEGISATVWDARFVKPLDKEMIKRAFSGKAVLTLEDGAMKGGLWSEVCERAALEGWKGLIMGHGIGDRFVSQARQAEQREEFGLDKTSIKSKLRLMREALREKE
ncbi:MAG: 1-deoxy-D-xylulose-5-phosphate synthase [Bacteroidales bacterium]|nr:1-deoxy-D-xylulose-5-phosphate synthase [Bacteroidales bacterium]